MTQWELSGLAWREGAHRGTVVSERGLRLIQGVSRGVWEATLPAQDRFDRLVASLNPDPWPAGAGVRLCVRVEQDGGWSRWCSLGVYGAGRGLPKSESAAAAPLRVAEDLLQVTGGASAVAVRLELEAGDLGGTPTVRRLALVAWGAHDPPVPDASAPSDAWGVELELPERSQRVEPGDLPRRGCSPVSLSMVLAYWGHDLPAARVASAVHDCSAGIYGNWSFNVAYAAELGLEATVARLDSLARLEEEVAQRRPVVISHKYEPGELSRTPLPRTDGHLIVVRGFTAEGDVVVNDPAADPARGESVRRVYRRAELAKTWLQNGDGIAYVIRQAS